MSPNSLATSIAAKQVTIMGINIVVLAVISVTSTIAVTGARTIAVKSAAMPTTAKPSGSSPSTTVLLRCDSVATESAAE